MNIIPGKLYVVRLLVGENVGGGGVPAAVSVKNFLDDWPQWFGIKQGAVIMAVEKSLVGKRWGRSYAFLLEDGRIAHIIESDLVYLSKHENGPS